MDILTINNERSLNNIFFGISSVVQLLEATFGFVTGDWREFGRRRLDTFLLDT